MSDATKKAVNAASKMRAAADAVNNIFREIDEQMEALHTERILLKDGSLSKGDYLQHVKNEIVRRGSLFGDELIARVSGMEKSFRRMSAPKLQALGTRGDPRYTMFLVHPDNYYEFQNMQCFYFGEHMVKRLDDALSAITWPEDAMPEVDIPARLDAIDQALAALQAQRDSVADSLDEAGFSG